jgi:hypothetical protein
MLHSQDGTRWCTTCGGCLTTLPDVESLDAALAQLEASHWERDGVMVWCLPCSRRRRAVPMPVTDRGVRRSRRW